MGTTHRIPLNANNGEGEMKFRIRIKDMVNLLTNHGHKTLLLKHDLDQEKLEKIAESLREGRWRVTGSGE